MPALLQIAAQFLKIEDFAVERDQHLPIFAADRLIPTAHIDDCQASHRHAEPAIDIEPVAVGTAMNDARVHALQQVGIDRLDEIG